MNDIPYHVLKNNKLSYKIMLLRDLHGGSFADLAKMVGLTQATVAYKYRHIKNHQIDLYINHISVMLGHDDISQIKKLADDADECYRDPSYVSAFLEKKYKDMLTEYRNGEPGMPKWFIRNLPPFKLKLSEKTISRIVEMREIANASFVEIGKELNITKEKAWREYDTFYHNKTVKIIRELLKKAETSEEEYARCLSGSSSCSF